MGGWRLFIIDVVDVADGKALRGEIEIQVCCLGDCMGDPARHSGSGSGKRGLPACGAPCVARGPCVF